MDQGIDFDRERKLLTRTAWGFTIAYGLVLLLILASFVIFGEEGVDSFLKMSPNEVGDLLAGIAGPIAFIWLVYGYFLQGIAIRQQAEELSQNTRALHLQEEALRAQVQELNASVEQQRQLVEVSRIQMETELEAIRIERKKQRDAAQPRFVFHGCGGMGVGGIWTYRTTIKNLGNSATQVAFSYYPEIKSSSITLSHSWEAGEAKELSWEYHTPVAEESVVLEISYLDSQGIPGSQTFELIPDLNHAWHRVLIRQIDPKEVES